MTPDEARDHIGREVAYRPDKGVITSVSDGVAWVRYPRHEHPVAVDPADLELLITPQQERRRDFRRALRAGGEHG